LKACGIAGATGKAQGVHAEIERAGLLEKNILIGSSLVDMYAKCGASEKAHEVFNKLPVRDVVCWTALITGYSLVGKDAMAISLFSEMVLAGIEPNAIVFTVLLNACSHCGLVDEAQTFFETMSSSFRILPNLEHWLCMIDVFGRSGHFNKALIITEKMPVVDTLAVWTALMGACQKWGNLELARLASANAVQHSDGNCISVHVCMRNICAASTI
jgi:pentatricopeptide repeat protein